MEFDFQKSDGTCPKIDNDVDHEDGVAKAVEGDPASAQVVVEERDGHGQDDQVGHQQEKHAQIPVEPNVIIIGQVIDLKIIFQSPATHTDGASWSAILNGQQLGHYCTAGSCLTKVRRP